MVDNSSEKTWQDVIAAAQIFHEYCIKKNILLTTAESCTGGLISAAITHFPGSSKYFDRGFITYSNDAKITTLGVAPDLLTRYGAVSDEVAKAMVIGALRNSKASVAVSVTGIAGPSGGSRSKPVGLVFVGFANNKTVCAKKYNFIGDREQIRLQTVIALLHYAMQNF